jgi:hypothetical protein
VVRDIAGWPARARLDGCLTHLGLADVVKHYELEPGGKADYLAKGSRVFAAALGTVEAAGEYRRVMA